MPADDPHTAPWGHSRAAHRVHGWCAHCTGRTAMDEAAAWRVRENETQRAEAGTPAVLAVEAGRG